MSFFIALFMTAVQAGATIYPTGDLTASGDCHFNFEYGVCRQGIQCQKFGAGWTHNIVISGRITDWPTSGGKTQYLELQPFETNLELHFVAKDYPDTSFPYAGLQKAVSIGLRTPDVYSHYFEREGSYKRDNYVRILGGRMILGRAGTARLGRYDHVRRDFQCDLKITE